MGIPIRGLKHQLLEDGTVAEIGLKNGNPDQGIETTWEWVALVKAAWLEEWESRSGD